MKILVVDGQGGRIGKMLVEQIKVSFSDAELVAVGTNSIATSAMIKAGADAGATGENPVIVNARDADIITGPVGIVMANTLYGEITPAMAESISSSKAKKILIPINKCDNIIIGIQEMGISDYIRLAVETVKEIMTD